MIILTINNFMGDEYQFSIPDTSGLVISEFRGTIPLNTRKTITAPFKKAALNDRITINDLNAAGRLIFSLLPDEVQDYLNQNQNEPVFFKPMIHRSLGNYAITELNFRNSTAP